MRGGYVMSQQTASGGGLKILGIALIIVGGLTIWL
jgi:hypothetical protein